MAQKVADFYIEMRAKGQAETQAALKATKAELKDTGDTGKELGKKAAQGSQEAKSAIGDFAEGVKTKMKPAKEALEAIGRIALPIAVFQQFLSVGTEVGNMLTGEAKAAEQVAKSMEQAAKMTEKWIEIRTRAAKQKIEGLDSDEARDYANALKEQVEAEQKLADLRTKNAELAAEARTAEERGGRISGFKKERLDKFKEEEKELQNEISAAKKRREALEAESTKKQVRKQADDFEESGNKKQEENQRKQAELKKQLQREVASEDEKIRLEAEEKRQQAIETYQNARSDKERKAALELLRLVNESQKKQEDELKQRRAKDAQEAMKQKFQEAEQFSQKNLERIQREEKSRADIRQGYELAGMRLGLNALAAEIKAQRNSFRD